MSVTKVSLTFLDASGEKSTVQYCAPALSALNIASISDNADYGVAATLAANIASLSLCTPISAQIAGEIAKSAQTPPGSNYAQREIGLLITYSDNVTGKTFRLTVPGPDWANMGLAGSDQIDPADAAWLAFKADFEAGAVSPDGNPVTVVSGKLVGRNR